MRKRNLRNKESGMALLISLMALFLISAIGLGMMYMSTGETSINANYKDTQLAFFAMRGGLEEARDRLRSNSPSSIAPLLTTMALPGNANSIVYITNPSAGETVDPRRYLSGNNQYFDDELCHETVAGVTCNQSIPASMVQPYQASIDPYSGQSSSMKYKWVRVTLKQNNTFPNALVAPIDATHTATSQVCWDSTTNREVLLSYLNSLGGPGTPYANCDAARTIGSQQVGPYTLLPPWRSPRREADASANMRRRRKTSRHRRGRCHWTGPAYQTVFSPNQVRTSTTSTAMMAARPPVPRRQRQAAPRTSRQHQQSALAQRA